jgi:non-heme chloroperoxidase
MLSFMPMSSGGRLAAVVALGHPDLVRSLTLAEPQAMAELLVDRPEATAVLDAWGTAFAPIRTAAHAGEAVQATTLFFELAYNQGPGAFERQPEGFRQMLLDNARTVPLQLAAPPPAISCAMLRGVQIPTLVVGGAQTPRYPTLINEVVVQCIPGSRLVVIPQATHLMSYQNPAAFNAALLHFLAQQ